MLPKPRPLRTTQGADAKDWCYRWQRRDAELDVRSVTPEDEGKGVLVRVGFTNGWSGEMRGGPVLELLYGGGSLTLGVRADLSPGDTIRITPPSAVHTHIHEHGEWRDR